MKKIAVIFAIALSLPVLAIGITSTKPNVYLFLQTDCPCVYSHKDSFAKLLRLYSNKVNFLVIFVDQKDSKAKIEKLLKELNWQVNYREDKDKKLAKRLKPEVSTDCVFADEKGNTLYKGAIDDGVKNMGMIKKFYLKDVIEAFLSGKPIPYSNAPGYGCRIM